MLCSAAKVPSFWLPSSRAAAKDSETTTKGEPNCGALVMASQSPWRVGGAVGLGIVAAMIEDVAHHSERPPAAAFPRSDRIPVSPPLYLVPVPQTGVGEDKEREEFSECYTCVISHVGGNHLRKMEYFDDGYGDGGVFCGLLPSQRQIPLSPSNFLSFCNLCRKELHGHDIFIYRGEKAFCSAECRYQQISSDEQKEQKQSSKAVKSLKLSARAPHPFSVIELGCSIVSNSAAPRHMNLYV